MKKFWRMIANTLLSCAMAFALTPGITAYGADKEEISIDTVELSYNFEDYTKNVDLKPVIGDSTQIAEQIFTVNGTNLKELSYAEGITASAKWVKLDGSAVGDTFEAGQKYAFEITFDFKTTDKYIYKDNTSGKIYFNSICDRTSTTSSSDGSWSTTLRYVGSSGNRDVALNNGSGIEPVNKERTTKSISSIEVVNENTNVYVGTSAKTVGTVLINGEAISGDDANHLFVKTYWAEKTSTYRYTAATTFEAGKSYQYVLEIASYDSVTTHYDTNGLFDESYNVNVKLNGALSTQGSTADNGTPEQNGFGGTFVWSAKAAVEAPKAQITSTTVTEVATSDTSRDNMDKIIAQAGLTDSTNATVQVSIADATPTEAEKTAIAAVLPEGYTAETYLDMTLAVVAGDTSVAITDAAAPVTLTVTIPASLQKADRVYKVIRLHDGKAEVIGTYTPASDYKISVSSDKFSTYALAYHDHTWGSATVVTQATSTTEGLKRYTCTACGATKDETIAKTSASDYNMVNTSVK